MKDKTPIAIRLAERLLSEDHHCLIGDVEWTWRELSTERGTISAWLWLWSTVFILVPRLLIRDVIWQHNMFRNYLKVALRQINKYKAFSTINVVALALSMSVCLLMFAMVQDYRSFDEFHPEGERLYRITSTIDDVWGRVDVATSSVLLGPMLVEESDEVESALRMSRAGGKLVRTDGRMATFRGLYAEPTFFELTGFKLSQGNASTALTAPFSMVLSQEFADELFPDRPAVGELVDRENGTYEITGIVAPPEGRSHLRFDALVSFSSLAAINADADDNPLNQGHVNTAYYNYVRLASGASIAGVEQAANSIGQRLNVGADSKPTSYELQAIADLNMGRELSNEIGPVLPAKLFVIFSMLAAILVGIAIFNYVNLTVSRSLRRTGEMGVRKVVGAHRRQLIQQFVTESVVTSLLALIIAIVFLQWLIPGFNSLGTISDEGMGVSVSMLDPSLLLVFFLFATLVGILAGILPALRMSGISPVAAFKGSTISKKSRRFRGRKVVTVVQFSLSTVTIITVLVLTRQFGFLSSANLALNESEIIQVNMSGVPYDQVKMAFERIPGVELVGATSTIPSGGSRTFADIRTPEMEDPLTIQHFGIDESFISQYNVSVVAGRNLSDDLGTDAARSILLTEKGVAHLGLGSAEEAVGAELVFDTYRLDERVTVAGVVSDFYSAGFENGYQPVALSMAPELFNYAVVLIAPGNPGSVLRDMEATWSELAPGLPLNARFLDDIIQANVDGRKADIQIISLFGGFIIIIACLGLLGMAMFSAETRLKEVGIRKTMGADSLQLVRLLSAEYVRLTVIAIVIALPLAWILNDSMLSNFANRIEVGPGILILGVLPVVGLALLTIVSQTWRAAMSNPVEVMRSE